MSRSASWYMVGRGFEDLEIYKFAQLRLVSSAVQLKSMSVSRQRIFKGQVGSLSDLRTPTLAESLISMGHSSHPCAPCALS